MKKTILFAAVGISVLILVLAAGCKQPSAGDAADGNPWVGIWEGKGSDGYIYSFHFTAKNWESYIEISGISLPFYRGTYTYTDTRVNLQVTEEGNYDTMGWMASKTAFPSITGRLSGKVLSVPTFTDADLVKE